jgi:hypothetical protein
MLYLSCCASLSGSCVFLLSVFPVVASPCYKWYHRGHGVGRVPTALRVICTLLISVHFSVLYLFEIVGLYFIGAQKALFVLLWRCFLLSEIVF